MKFEFCNKKKTNDITADVVLVAAAAGAVAAGCVIAAYEALKSEKGQAAIAKTKAATVAAAAKTKAATVAAAGKVKETATAAAGKVKETAVNAVDAVKAKLPKKERLASAPRRSLRLSASAPASAPRRPLRLPSRLDRLTVT